MVYSNRNSLVFLTELQDSANITDLEFVFWVWFFYLVTKGKKAVENM